MRNLVLTLLIALLATAFLYGRDTRRVDDRRKRPRAGLNTHAMLEAIAAVESGNNAQAVGQRGERGRCQFMKATWYHHTAAEFLVWAPVDCEFTRKIEQAHLGWIGAQLLKQGHQLEPALIAAAWRFGVGRAVANIRSDSAQRTANLYFDFLAREEGVR